RDLARRVRTHAQTFRLPVGRMPERVLYFGTALLELTESARRARERLLLHLLGEQITAEGDAAAEDYRREVAALGALVVGPGLEGRCGAGDGRAKQAEQAVVQGNRADSAALVRMVRAKLQDLNDARKVIGRNRVADAGDLAHLLGQGDGRGSGQERPAVEKKEQQQETDRAAQDDGSGHRCFTANPAGARRASSGSLQKA